MAKSPSRETPVLHLLMGVAGWVAYIFEQHMIVLILAVILSLLVVPRLVRGSLEKAEDRTRLRLEQPPEPRRRVSRVTAPDEVIVWESSQHPIVLLPWILGAMLLTGGAILLDNYVNWMPAAIVWGAGMMVFSFKVFVWHQDRLCLTNQRLFAVWGIFSKRVGTMPLRKLTDETLSIPPHSRILAWLRLISTEYGTLIVESAGQDQALKKVFFVPNVVAVNLLIMGRALK